MSTYLLERTSEIVQSDENIVLPENDFIITFNVTWANMKQVGNAIEIDLQVFNKAGLFIWFISYLFIYIFKFPLGNNTSNVSDEEDNITTVRFIVFVFFHVFLICFF